MRDEKQRQKTRERKRKRREQKRRTHEAGAARLVAYEGPGRGYRKLSEVLLDFIAPIFEMVPEEHHVPEVVQNFLELGADVWNVIVDSEPEDVPRRLAELSGYHARKRNAPEAPIAELVLGLAERKQRDFAHDHRLVLGVHAGWNDARDEVRVYAAGVLPGTRKPVPPGDVTVQP